MNELIIILEILTEYGLEIGLVGIIVISHIRAFGNLKMFVEELKEVVRNNSQALNRIENFLEEQAGYRK